MSNKQNDSLREAIKEQDEELIHEARLRASAVLAYAIETQANAIGLIRILDEIKQRQGLGSEFLHNEGGSHGKD